MPFSILYGDVDWLLSVDNGNSKRLLESKKTQFPDQENEYKLHIIPESNHNLHFDNPQALANAIINDLLGENLPILKPYEYK